LVYLKILKNVLKIIKIYNLIKITILEGDGWYFQRDNELPFELKEGVDIFIPRLEWHRVIKIKRKLK